MPNEVEIRITATDLTGPVFAGIMSRITAVKALLKSLSDPQNINLMTAEAMAKLAALKAEADTISFGSIDMSKMTSSLTALRSKIQSLGIADIADVDVQPGRIMVQMQLLKRLIDQAGISDLLDINISPSELASQLANLGQLQYDIPVNFDMSKMPTLGATSTLSVPINLDIAELKTEMLSIPRVGPTMRVPVDLDFKSGPLNISSIPTVGPTMEIKTALDLSGLKNGLNEIPKFGPTMDIPTALGALDFASIPKVGPSVQIPLITGAIDFASIPKVGPIMEIPVKFVIPELPNLTENVGTNIDVGALDSAIQAEEGLAKSIGDVGYANAESGQTWDMVISKIFSMADAAGESEKYMGGLGDAFVSLLPYISNMASYISSGAIPSLRSMGSYMSDLADNAIVAFSGAAVIAGRAVTSLDDNISLGLPLWENTSNMWYGLGGHVQLFAGALTQIGIPSIIGTASALHILIDGVIETVATLGPAIIGLGAFAASAVDTSTEVYDHFVDLNKVTDELQQNIYPLSGAFAKMNQAAQPQVYVLLGEGLQVVSKNSGILATVANQAGGVMDQLGARMTYALTQGNGFNMFTKNAAADLSGWGNNLGDVFGIIGNILKQMPGYAEVILSVVGSVLKFGEAITGSGIGQDIIGMGLAVHGAVLYIGLLGTAAASLISSTLPAIATGALRVGLAFDAMGADGAAAAMSDFAASAAEAATLPWGWITIAAAGIGVLVYDLVNAKSAAEQFADTIQKNITSVPLQNLGTEIGTTLVNATNNEREAYFNFLAVLGNTQALNDNISKTAAQEQAYYNAAQAVANYKQVIVVAQQDQDTYNKNLAQAASVLGGTKAALAALSNAGITSNQMLTTSKQTMSENIIEALGYNEALKAVTNGTGQMAAALNALSGPEQYMGDYLKSIQAITQAQDTLISTVTQSETAFDTFAEGTQTLGTDMSGTGAKVTDTLGKISVQSTNAAKGIGGLDNASLNLNQAFYAQITNSQKVIDGLEQQMASSKDLTTATATMAGQMLPFAQNNTAARASIVALINDALGPGTVNLKDLNTWVKTNSTSMQGFQAIVETSTIKAGTLANVLQTDLTAQFKADLLQSSGATGAMKLFTDAVVNGGTQTSAYKGARQQLINDLINTGLNATQAKAYVKGLQGQIDTLSGKTVGVHVTGSGSGGVEITGNGAGVSETEKIAMGSLSTGGVLPGYGGGDRRLYMLEDGEAVVDKDRTKKYAGLLAKMGVPGMSVGGLVGSSDVDFGSNATTGVTAVTTAALKSVKSQFEAALAKAAAVSTSVGLISPHGTGSTIEALMKSMAASVGWTGAQWTALYDVEEREAGFNMTATNPTSGAYGLAQFIDGASEYAQYGGNSTTAQGQIVGMLNYIKQRYGTPEAAWAHEVDYGWYDNGGWLQPGYTLAYNGTGKPEAVGGSPMQTISFEIGSSGSQAFDAFMMEWIQKTVRTKGGGDVQFAFGKGRAR